MPLILSLAIACAITPIDGDNVRCGRENIRVLGIDAPEMPGHCRRGRVCAPGDPYRSRERLREAITGPASIERVGRDRYGRTLAVVTVNGVNLSCHQLAGDAAMYRPDWDNGGRIARDCYSSAPRAFDQLGARPGRGSPASHQLGDPRSTRPRSRASQLSS